MPRLSRLLAAVCAVTLLSATVRAVPPDSSLLQRFLSGEETSRIEYRALRHLDAHNDKFDKSGWMDVWTSVDRAGVFRFSVAAEGGSPYIRDHVMLPALETEQRMLSQYGTERIALTRDNYIFEEQGADDGGLVTFGVKPRRKDALLVDGSVFLRPEDGELVRLEGQLVKPPSFWTRHVQIVRWYQRIAGVRMPVATESVAAVLVAGRSTFRVTYDYEMVNGQTVGSPQPRGH